MLETRMVFGELVRRGYTVVNFDENGYLCMAPLEGHSPRPVVTLPYGQKLLPNEVVREVLRETNIDWEEFIRALK